MKKILAIVILITLSFPILAQNTEKLLEDYVNIKNSLVESDSKLAKNATVKFYEDLKKEENFKQKTALLAATEKLKNADNNIEKQRNAFMKISSLLWEMVKSSDSLKQPVYYQYCPMVKGYWISKEKEIKNPYYGSAMLECGYIEETK